MAADRERRTIEAMVEIYCRAHHDPETLCERCRELLEYALAKLAKCPYQPDKPTCANCPIHCYQRDRRDQIREVMKFSGPRMIWQHPSLAVRHLLQGRRAAPERPARKQL